MEANTVVDIDQSGKPFGFREIARKEWEDKPITIRISHNGNFWEIRFAAVGSKFKMFDDEQDGTMPGWWSSDNVKTHLDALPESVRKCCNNYEEATSLKELERIRLSFFSEETAGFLTIQAQRAQGMVDRET